MFHRVPDGRNRKAFTLSSGESLSSVSDDGIHDREPVGAKLVILYLSPVNQSNTSQLLRSVNLGAEESG